MSLTDNVLTFVNTERANLTLPPLYELPTGVPGDEIDCVIGRCFNSPGFRATAGGRMTVVQDLSDDHIYEIAHPEYVTEFVNRFDEGHYPALIDDEAA